MIILLAASTANKVMTEHRVFLFFLAVLSLSAILVLAFIGIEYYWTPVPERPFRPDHEHFKASADYSHGLGIVGTALVILGVSAYSTRKRIKALWSLGRLSVWLNFHITVCLLGPILVIFHTTFKAGGIAAISLWTMIAVWLSGMMGRFLYVQIPRNVEGMELSDDQIRNTLAEITAGLEATPTGKELSGEMNNRFRDLTRPASLTGTLSALVRLAGVKRSVRAHVRNVIRRAHLTKENGSALRRAADARVSLMQKAFALGQVQRLFHYWHLIHLPFTVIMFLTLAAHVAVTLLMGYTWIF